MTFLLAACGQNSQLGEPSLKNTKTTSKDSLQTFSITKATAADFSKAKRAYVDKTRYDSTTFTKVGREIKLPIAENGESIVRFKDTLVDTDESDVRQYKYIGRFEKIGFYIVGGDFWEHTEYYLIDKKTGRQTTTWGLPKISPRDKYIASLSMPYGLEGEPNGIQVWRLDRDEKNKRETVSLSKHVELDQQDWAPDDFI